MNLVHRRVLRQKLHFFEICNKTLPFVFWDLGENKICSLSLFHLDAQRCKGHRLHIGQHHLLCHRHLQVNLVYSTKITFFCWSNHL